ncbi:MAG: beta-phosphoglucomutase [Odoribacter sp.]|nr:beta-phosphoglucomutase [Odoribacter sp.]
MRIEACIFDLDGVLVDTAKYHYLAWKRLADDLGILFTEKDNERLKGVSRMTSLDIILELGNLTLSEAKKQEYASLKNMWYVDYINRMTPEEILPGALNFIRELKAANIRVAIGSASRNTPLILERVNLNNLFDAVADGNNVKKAKPDPEVFLTASKLLGVKPERCIVFEDAAAGVQAALNAGMKCVGIGSAEILSDAHLIVRGLDEMNINRLRVMGKLS